MCVVFEKSELETIVNIECDAKFAAVHINTMKIVIVPCGSRAKWYRIQNDLLIKKNKVNIQ